MPKENITLTPQEQEELKDTLTFRIKTSIYLKQLAEDFKDHCKSSQEFRDDVKSLKIHRIIHWTLISAIFLAIFTMPLWFTKAMMMVNK